MSVVVLASTITDKGVTTEVPTAGGLRGDLMPIKDSAATIA
jgi:hypothetical protein